jgi:hypothetical protein
MQKKVYIVALLFALFQSCNTSQDEGLNVQVDSSAVLPPLKTRKGFAFENEQQYLGRKSELCNGLGIYDIQQEVVPYELRVWKFPSMWDPSILYVLKEKDSVWTLFHYQYYTMRATRQDEFFDNPIVDSVVMESLIPRTVSWTGYIKNLALENLWKLATESSMNEKTFDVVDGSRTILEIRQGDRYKYVFYTTPETFVEKDENHKLFIEFKKRLIEPVIYNGMRNP